MGLDRTGPPARRTPLNRGGQLRRGTGLARANLPSGQRPLDRTRSAKATRPARRSTDPNVTRPSWGAVRIDVIARDGGMCRACTHDGHPRPGSQVHHAVTRARGGVDHPANLVLLCAYCHAVAHDGAAGTAGLWLRPGRFLFDKLDGTWRYDGPDDGYREVFDTDPADGDWRAWQPGDRPVPPFAGRIDLHTNPRQYAATYDDRKGQDDG